MGLGISPAAQGSEGLADPRAQGLSGRASVRHPTRAVPRRAGESRRRMVEPQGERGTSGGFGGCLAKGKGD